MNVYFGCSTQRILEFKKAYLTTRQAILTAGNKLTRDWLDDAILLKSKKTNKLDLRKPPQQPNIKPVSWIPPKLFLVFSQRFVFNFV